ncbi:MAG TPA: hypothetical protein VHM19_20195 [Polyangiales bacterium]|nr:hypothetical protein [Polyangiales bacterium]
MTFPRIAFGTPRKLPKPQELKGRVVVLDIAFAAGAGGASFETTTKPFIDGLGDRLAAWIDHHDHAMHAAYSHDSRFVLRTKAEHGACPEMVTPERVAQAGAVDTLVCHTDFDGLCSAAKWIRGGSEPYPGADDDARAIDTRLGTPSERANVLDRALRARPRDDAMRGLIVKFLADGCSDLAVFRQLEKASEGLRAREDEARRIALGYEVRNDIAFVKVPMPHAPYDKTLLLMIGQERARISIALDEAALTVAARFDSGIDLLQRLGLEGGMPTVVSLMPKDLDDVLRKLGWPGASPTSAPV